MIPGVAAWIQEMESVWASFISDYNIKIWVMGNAKSTWKYFVIFEKHKWEKTSESTGNILRKHDRRYLWV